MFSIEPRTLIGLTMRRSPPFFGFQLALSSRTPFGCDGNTAPALNVIVCIHRASSPCQRLNLVIFCPPACPHPFLAEPAGLATQPCLPALPLPHTQFVYHTAYPFSHISSRFAYDPSHLGFPYSFYLLYIVFHMAYMSLYLFLSRLNL